jgi:hypothetical protein
MLAVVGATATAIGQPYAPPPEPAEPEHAEGFFTRVGITIAAGGGVEGFTNDTLRGVTEDGGNWNVRAALGTRALVAFEASYLGSAQSIDEIGLDHDAVLVGNGVQGLLRLNATTNHEVQPFVFAGVAWRHYDITNADFNLSEISGEDDVLEIPMGAGVAFKYMGLVLDARGEYRPSTGEDMMPSLSSTTEIARMHRWGVNANIGYEF